MNTVQTIGALLAALGGIGGWATALRARSQNRLDTSRSKREAAEADAIAVDTARDLILELKAEMDRRLTEQGKEIARLEGRLSGALEQRDRFREEAERLHRLCRDLEEKLRATEERLREAVDALAREKSRRLAMGGDPSAARTHD